jgi:hypothetical protein
VDNIARGSVVLEVDHVVAQPSAICSQQLDGNGLSSPQLKEAVMATSAERQNMIRTAREMANSGQFSGWVAIESSMKWDNKLCQRDNPLEDLDLRRELDARCSAAQREKAARVG